MAYKLDGGRRIWSRSDVNPNCTATQQHFYDLVKLWFWVRY